MSDRVLFVDDEQDVLDGYERLLRRSFHVRVALGGRQGLEEIERNGPFAVVISDMRMPGMNGAEFLARVRQLAPDTVRMLLTGHADLSAAIDAINEGNILRFLTKPCEENILVDAINVGISQHRQVSSDKELIKRAKALELSAAGHYQIDNCQWDNGAGPTGLPGPTQARAYLTPFLGEDRLRFVNLLKLTAFQILEERYGEGPAAEYLNYVAQSIVRGMRSEDRVFHWGRDIFMVVAHRHLTPNAMRQEIARVVASNRDHLTTVNGRNIMIATPIVFDLVTASQFTDYDAMLQVLSASLSCKEELRG